MFRELEEHIVYTAGSTTTAKIVAFIVTRRSPISMTVALVTCKIILTILARVEPVPTRHDSGTKFSADIVGPSDIFSFGARNYPEDVFSNLLLREPELLSTGEPRICFICDEELDEDATLNVCEVCQIASFSLSGGGGGGAQGEETVATDGLGVPSDAFFWEAMEVCCDVPPRRTWSDFETQLVQFRLHVNPIVVSKLEFDSLQSFSNRTEAGS